MHIITLSDAEFALLKRFMEDLGDAQGNAGCNDFYLDNTPENLEMVKAACKDFPDMLDHLDPKSETILTMDVVLHGHLCERLGLDEV